MATVYLGFGSNMGDRLQNIADAMELLSEKIKVGKLSSIYETEPVGFAQQPYFLNAACRVSTSLNPQQLLTLVKSIETRLGRKPSFPNAPRPLDIDILLYDNLVINSSELIIPHPRLAERAFVLAPLAELAPQISHPVLNNTISELCSSLDSMNGIRKFADAKQVTSRRQHVPGIH